MDRSDIVKRVVTTFIDFEKDKKGKGVKFIYPVEGLSDGRILYIHRPTRKWNFDFKVEIPQGSELGEGKHFQIALFIRRLKESDKKKFEKVWEIINCLYHCQCIDVDAIMREKSIGSKEDITIEILLKVIKWLFIMEDIIYWNYEGRAFLYNFLVYVINEKDEKRLKDISKINRVSKLKDRMRDLNIKWVQP